MFVLQLSREGQARSTMACASFSACIPDFRMIVSNLCEQSARSFGGKIAEQSGSHPNSRFSPVQPWELLEKINDLSVLSDLVTNMHRAETIDEARQLLEQASARSPSVLEIPKLQNVKAAFRGGLCYVKNGCPELPSPAIRENS